jgi:hypothetical protein
MGKVYPAIDDRIEAFLRAQRLFFVATAPLSRTGHVNVSPKGLDSFAILDRETVAYLDLGGSGIETIAHLRENGRIVLMFCAFEGPPKIVRLHGRGEVVEVGEPGFEALAAHFPKYAHARAVIRVRCTRISDSCGYGVPLFEFAGQRSQLLEWSDRKGEAGIRQYREEHNRRSLDGLPGLRAV